MAMQSDGNCDGALDEAEFMQFMAKRAKNAAHFPAALEAAAQLLQPAGAEDSGQVRRLRTDWL